MRIIKEGRLPPKEKKMTCHECGCVFMYECSDIYSDQREGCWVVCPTCKKYIIVDGDMNKILKKRFEEAAEKSSFHYLSQDEIEELELECHYDAGFSEGAEYALSHQWISVEEALPEEEDWVVVMYSNGLMEIRKGIYVRVNKPICEDIKIVYWMAIPKLKMNI